MVIEDLALIYVFKCSACLPLKVLVSSLIFRSLIHFEFIFVYGVRTEKAMAPHSSILAWRIPGTGEPGGLPSMGSHKSWTQLK